MGSVSGGDEAMVRMVVMGGCRRSAGAVDAAAEEDRRGSIDRGVPSEEVLGWWLAWGGHSSEERCRAGVALVHGVSGLALSGWWVGVFPCRWRR